MFSHPSHPAKANCAILNAGSGAWAFEAHAQHLARVLGVPVQDVPAAHNYLLGWDVVRPLTGASFVPYEAILLASDKRWLAQVFTQYGVATPRTFIVESEPEVQRLLEREAAQQWVLKWPIGCGAAGHCLLEAGMPIPPEWPRPYLLQEFIARDQPEVYRLYAVAGETFGWNARRFPPGAKTSPWVAHVQGARYEPGGTVPEPAEAQARLALDATGLLGSFGCADLLQSEDGRWLVLEVNTDGIFNHVDRDIDVADIADAMDRRLAQAFWAWAQG